MHKMKISAGLLIASLASVTLYAAPGDRKVNVTKEDMLARADARFAKMDTNRDGKIDQADRAARLRQYFATMDTDGNGSVSESEFVTSREANIAKRAERREMRAGRARAAAPLRARARRGAVAALAMADANGDKAVTSGEFRAAAEARFAKADLNRDGTVTAEERRAQRRANRKGRWGDRSAAPGEVG